MRLFRRKPELTPAAELRPGDELVRAMSRYLYAQAFATVPKGQGLRGDARWVMSPAWLEVVDDLVGMPLPRVPVPSGTVVHVLGMPVTTDPDGGRPHVVAGVDPQTGEGSRCDAADECVLDPECPFVRSHRDEADDCPACHDTYVDLAEHWRANYKGCAPVLLDRLPWRVRLRLAVDRRVTQVFEWIGDHVGWRAAERFLRILRMW